VKDRVGLSITTQAVLTDALAVRTGPGGEIELNGGHLSRDGFLTVADTILVFGFHLQRRNFAL